MFALGMCTQGCVITPGVLLSSESWDEAAAWEGAGGTASPGSQFISETSTSRSTWLNLGQEPASFLLGTQRQVPAMRML